MTSGTLYFMGIEVGTAGIKTVLVNEKGQTAFSSWMKFQLILLNPYGRTASTGMVEINHFGHSKSLNGKRCESIDNSYNWNNGTNAWISFVKWIGASYTTLYIVERSTK